MNLGIEGKRVLVVGVGKGIGPAVIRAYAAEGSYVTAVSRNELDLKDIFGELENENGRHDHLCAELMEDNQPHEAARELLKRHSCYDIIIHNIGHHFHIRDPLAPMEDWYKVWKLNIGIAIEMNSVLLPPMIHKKWGRVIHMSSASARVMRGSPQYVSSKAYINAYVTTVGRSLADKGIVMSALMPGAVDFKGGYWDEIKNTNPEKYHGFLKEHQAVQRMGTPEEIASFAVFMGSELASFAAASLVPVDGGHM